MNNLVSVIIPAYNAEKFIKETIDSALNQTHQNIELIVVNDGSTDQTLAVLNSIKDNRLRIITQANKGASFAKQIGLQHAKGDFVQYLDADDLLSADKIEAQIELLIDRPNCISVCATVHFYDGTNPLSYQIPTEWYANGEHDPVDFLIKLYGGSLIGPLYGGMIQPNAFLAPMALIKKAGPWNIEISPCPDEDGEYFCRVILAAEKIIYANKGVNYYRKFRNQQSLSAVKNYRSCKNILQSTLLKTQHLLNATSLDTAKLAMSSQLWHDAFMFYPKFKDLSAEAEKEAKVLYPGLKINFFKNKIKALLSATFGWKFVSYLEHFRKKID